MRDEMAILGPCASENQGLPATLSEREQLNAWLEMQAPQHVLRWAVGVFGAGLVMTTAFGLNGVALIHMLQEVTRDVPLVFVDTGLLFEETLETKRQIEQAFGLQVQTWRPRLSIEAQAQQYGPDLHACQPDLCCALRKVEPMHRAVAELGPLAVVNGRSRSQSKTRRDLPVVQWERTPVWINPLARWTQQQVEDYVQAHGIPHNPLHEAGYPSVGCRPCTRPVREGEHVRAGRWAGSGKAECGLWTMDFTSDTSFIHIEGGKT
jgi:phosphoadenosine phosphosulfate reductase